MLQMTDHKGVGIVSRFAYHFDPFFVLLSPLYYLHDDAETLVVAQTVALALGAIPVYLLSTLVFTKKKIANITPKIFGLLFAFLYLNYFPEQWTTINDVHMVVFATPLLLAAFYLAIIKNFKTSFIFILLALLTKENVALTVIMMGIYFFLQSLSVSTPGVDKLSFRKKESKFGLMVIILGAVTFITVMFYIIPINRPDLHFASHYYTTEMLENLRRLSQESTFDYFFLTLSPMAFMSLLSPLHLAISAPEWAINLLSKNTNLRSLQYQYTALITAFVTISSIYGLSNLLIFLQKKLPWKKLSYSLIIILIFASMSMAYRDGPLPVARYSVNQEKLAVVRHWQDILKDKNIAVSATGRLGPHFSNRKHFYNFLFDFAYGVQGETEEDLIARVDRYESAEYVLIQKSEVEGEENEIVSYYYSHLKNNPKFEKVFDESGIEVYHHL